MQDLQAKSWPPNAGVRQWVIAQRARCCGGESGGLASRNRGRNRRNTSMTVPRQATRQSARQLAAEFVHEPQGILRRLMRHVQVDHGGGDLLMAEQLLNRVQMRAGFQQMRGKGMATMPRAA